MQRCMAITRQTVTDNFQKPLEKKRKHKSTVQESFVANKNNLKLAETDLINFNADLELCA